MVRREFTTLGISANTDKFVRQSGEPGQDLVPIPPLKQTNPITFRRKDYTNSLLALSPLDLKAFLQACWWVGVSHVHCKTLLFVKKSRRKEPNHFLSFIFGRLFTIWKFLFSECISATNFWKPFGTKGQIISKANFLVLQWTKNRTKSFFDFFSSL